MISLFGFVGQKGRFKLVFNQRQETSLNVEIILVVITVLNYFGCTVTKVFSGIYGII